MSPNTVRYVSRPYTCPGHPRLDDLAMDEDVDARHGRGDRTGGQNGPATSSTLRFNVKQS